MPRVRIGEPVARKEDFRLVTGQGTYADDIHLPGTAYAAFVRSPHAHARIRSIDTTAAKAMPGVLAVVTAADTAALKSILHATGSSKGGSDVGLANRDGTERLTTPHVPLQSEIVRFAGEIVAMVVAESQEEAKDAAEQVVVDWEPLPAVTATPEAVKPGAPELWPEVPKNLALDCEIGDAAATEAAFAKAAHRVKLVTWVQRVTGVHMEPRTAIGAFDKETQRYVLYACGGIGVTRLREELSTVLGVPLERTRIITPQDVGGNFGTRNAFHPEWGLLPWMAERLGRPVKHLVERSEAFVSDYQGRDLFVEAELALDADGRFLAVRTSNLSNVGAHTASFVALNKGVQLMTSVYAVPAAHVRGRAVMSNTPSTIPYRSAGRPEAIFVIERLIDLAAREGGFDRVELRRKNLIAPEAMPYRNPVGVTYDNGNYADLMMTTVEAADWAGFPARREEAKRRGKLRGIGVANYVETASGMPRERADIVVSSEGRVDAVLGTAPTGQSHETTFAQLMSDWLAVDFDDVTVRFGDTDIVHAGGGSHSGRSMRFASIVIKAATDEIVAKGKEIAAAKLEAAVGDIEFADGRFVVAGTDRGMTLYEAAAAAEKGDGLPEPLRGRLAATSDKMIGGLAFPFGSHVCEVEVDPETGRVAIVRHTCIDDVGRAVNPMVVEGQSHGGIVQGMGQALMEHCVMDPETGQPLAGSFMDYPIPRADEFPMFDARLAELPATSHPLGIRPGGEGGTTPALAVAVNAIVDALAPLGVTHLDMPTTPYRVWRAIQDARRG